MMLANSSANPCVRIFDNGVLLCLSTDGRYFTIQKTSILIISNNTASKNCRPTVSTVVIDFHGMDGRLAITPKWIALSTVRLAFLHIFVTDIMPMGARDFMNTIGWARLGDNGCLNNFHVDK